MSCVIFLFGSAHQSFAETGETKSAPLIPYQDFTEDDIKRFPPDLLQEIREKEQYWGEVILEHRKQYEEYYKDILGPGIYSTWDVYKKEMALMSEPSYQQLQGPVIEKKTLKRFPDRVWVAAGFFQTLKGEDIPNLRLLCYRFNRLQVVPFDIDEGTEDGTKILTHGPENNAHLADEKFNHTDQLVFLAHDSGDRIDTDYIINQYGKEVLPIETELVDPNTGEKGWFYLTYFPSNPPPKSEFDYITFLNETVNQQFTDYIWHQSTFAFHKDKVYRKIFCRSWKYAPFYGYTGEELVDRLKARITTRLCFGLLKFKVDEDDTVGNWLAWKDGQVVATGRGWIGVKLPLGLKSPSLIFDVVASETVLTVPSEIYVPVNPGIILTDYTMKVGTDWHLGSNEIGNNSGYRFYNSNNLDGVKVDGVMSDRERRWNPAKDQWRILTGPAGAIGFRSWWDSHYESQAEITVRYTDDVTESDKPEFHSGQVAMHYSISTIKSLEPRTYETLMDWYGPPHFWNPDPNKIDWRLFRQYLDISSHPIEFKIGKRTGENPMPKLYYLDAEAVEAKLQKNVHQ